MWDNIRFFKPYEFDSPDAPGSGAQMDPTFMLALDAARLKAGVPFVISSGYRTPTHNKRIGGVPNSVHLEHKAADIRVTSDYHRFLILNSLTEVGFERLGIGRNFIHADIGSTKPSPRIWTYYGIAKDESVSIPDVEVSIQLTKDSNPLDWSHTLYGIPEMHKQGFKGKGVKVAVLDTGLDSTHPSFSRALSEGRLKSIDARGINQPLDKNGHGTWCVSRFISEGQDALGFAPECSVTSYKVLNDNGSGSLLNVIRGVEMAIAEGVDIISTSLGWPTQYTPFDAVVRKVRDAGILWFSAAGNDGTKEDIDYPGLYPDVFAIPSHGPKYERSKFSDFGVDADIYGPGQAVKAAYLGNTEAFLSGTSMATPSVAALIAALKPALEAKYRKITRETLKQAVRCL